MCLEVVQRIFATDEDVLSCTALVDVMLVECDELAGCDFLLKCEAMLLLNLEYLVAVGGNRFFAHKHGPPREAIRMLQIGIHEHLSLSWGHTGVWWQAWQDSKQRCSFCR
ncbi:MAG: hypothetical protein CMO32_00285 [Variovorax sp.]|nr:hypothetical protein [Variovorax sp.]